MDATDESEDDSEGVGKTTTDGADPVGATELSGVVVVGSSPTTVVW